MQKPLSLIAALVVLAPAGDALAHHSAAMFDHTRIVEISGTVKSFSYQAPHSWISIVGSHEGKGDPVQWDLELGAPLALKAWGIGHDTLKAGDKVSVGLYPIRDGRNAGSLLFLVDAEGKPHGVKRDDAYAALPK